LREQLEQLKDSSQGRSQQGQQQGKQSQQGQQPGEQQGQQGKQGQAPGQQPGQSPSANGSTGGTSSGSGSPDVASGTGGRIAQEGGVPGRGIDPANVERTLREGVRDPGQLEQMLRGNRDIPREFSRDVQDLLREMQGIDPKRLRTAPERMEQIVDQLVGGVEQIELQLRRLADDQQSGSVRSGTSQPPPPGYTEAVAEYFRRLAKQK